MNNILIIEDEAIIGMSLAADLEDLGYASVEVASTGEEAIKFVQDNNIEILLLDLKLRGSMDGLETLRKIREFADPFVIITSGNSEIKTFIEIREMVVDGFLVKPISLTELQLILNSLHK